MARRRTAFEWRQLFLTTLVCTVGLGTLRSAAIAFARSLQTGTLEELNALVAG